jgi:hypothetical protein
MIDSYNLLFLWLLNIVAKWEQKAVFSLSNSTREVDEIIIPGKSKAENYI